MEDVSGVYEADDSTLRAFACPSPSSPYHPHPRTQIDFVLPPMAVFHNPGDSLMLYPPVLASVGRVEVILDPGPRYPLDLLDNWQGEAR
ncbi:hypothetical protein K503DRAFT_806304 [Rhizopogon vinicolor AM-OR11-026]|uniref:Uncharacterized protein n=1 Tax=Rhizopogon vinicolor AM-OR11-026 TaxID=1314800 RepID=A0A1B7MEY8_9AGAM|nr:hypothetical protein K503DRAFT_806304 [Rhizopogon vinicolor AM-OR11-026]